MNKFWRVILMIGTSMILLLLLSIGSNILNQKEQNGCPVSIHVLGLNNNIQQINEVKGFLNANNIPYQDTPGMLLFRKIYGDSTIENNSGTGFYIVTYHNSWKNIIKKLEANQKDLLISAYQLCGGPV